MISNMIALAARQAKSKLFTLLALLLTFSSLLTAQIPERTFYITPDGDNDCSDNYCGLQAALDSCAIDSANFFLLLADGVYHGQYVLEPDSGASYGDLYMEGGWNNDFTERNHDHMTIFDGENTVQAFRLLKYKGERPGSISIDHITVQNCRNDGGGGGMLVQSYGDNITISNCIIMNNESYGAPDAGRNGGGVFTYTFNPETNDGGSIRYLNNFIANNSAGVGASYGQGGGIFTYATDTLLLVNNIIADNEALGSNGIGGGIEFYSRGSEVIFVNNTIAGNYAEISGGGTANHVSSPLKESNFEYVNNIINHNSRGSGFGYGMDVYSGASVVNGKAVTISYHHNQFLSYAMYPGTATPVYTDNLISYTAFADTMYHISTSAFGVDKGDSTSAFLPEYDFFGNKRIQYDQVDIGAHESDGLALYYKLDGNTDDESLNQIEGSFLTSVGSGISNNEVGAAHLVHDSMRILVPHRAELNFPFKISISLWMYADSLQTPSHLLNKGHSCEHNGNYHLALGRGGGLSADFDRPTFSFWQGSGANHMYVCNDTIRQGEWNHFALSYDFIKMEMQMYLNGAPVSGFWFADNIPGPHSPYYVSYSLGIGATITAEDGCNGKLAGEGQYPFFGKIDEVKLYAQVLSAAQITDISSYPPYGIVLASNQVNENTPVHTLVGSLSALDPNTWDDHSFALVPGTGATHNDLFEIDNEYLQLASEINYEENSMCDVLIEATDPSGGSFQKAFQVEVMDMNDPPEVVTSLEDQNLLEGHAWTYAFPETSFSDEDTWDHLSYTPLLEDESPLPDWMDFDEGSREFSGTPVPTGTDNYTIVVSAEDDSAAVVTSSFNVSVAVNSVDITETLDFRMYPQPVHDLVYVESEAGSYDKLEIYSVTGKLLQLEELDSSCSVIDLSNLRNGMYIFHAIGTKSRISGRFVKM